jgi:uncharacterized hydrophobic protein (TIGR00271 family)
MRTTFARFLLPLSQRRTLDELTGDLDLSAGDADAKKSAFWIMLTLSALIASAGVLADSTATVIGAMIIAPLSTPIMGIALGIAKQEAGAAARAGRYVIGGGLLVVLIGVVFALVAPGTQTLLTNGQIASRTSPGIIDLVAAIATGFAGAIALARRDVAAVLPGVAIAISLVPPLAVVGVCLGHGSVGLALGALVLFLSNLVALVLAGTLVFTAVGYSAEATGDRPRASRRKAYLTLGIVLVVVIIPLLANTVATYIVSVWADRVQQKASTWISAVPGASIEGVDFASTTMYVRVQTPGRLPEVAALMSELNQVLPDGISVVVNTSLGEQINAGNIGGG